MSEDDTALPPVPDEVPPFYAGVVIWGRSGDLLLQLRDDIPGIVNPGMIGTFGGGGIEGETPLEAALREVKEETNLNLDPDQVIPLRKREHRFVGNLVIPVYDFGALDVPEDGLRVTEGVLYRLAPEDFEKAEKDKITEGAREAIRLLLDRFEERTR